VHLAVATYGKAVEYLANDIQRGFNYVYQVHGVEGAEAAACSSITQVFLPRIVEASKKGLRSIEVPVTITQRISGTSKKPTHFRYGLGFANALVRAWLR